ncbi:potassium channel family protein [Neisseriaceae bacterium JH1-16]|nr:potassium channel family protein [Neisseriaceae bacterium JH1-16]
MIASTDHGPQSVDYFTAQYFSFISLTTLGFGDVVAGTRAARGLVMFEAVSGQLYLAVLVARLVGLYGSEMVVRHELHDRRERRLLKLRDRRQRFAPRDGDEPPP